MATRKMKKSQAKAFRDLAGQIIMKNPANRDPLIVYGTIANLLAAGLDKAFLTDDPQNIISRQQIGKIAAILQELPSDDNGALSIHLLVFLVVCVLKHPEIFTAVRAVAVAEKFLKPKTVPAPENIAETQVETLAAQS